MKELIKTYGIGLLFLGLLIQPYYFGKFIGIADIGILYSYMGSLCAEIVIILLLILPLWIGIRLRDIFEEK